MSCSWRSRVGDEFTHARTTKIPIKIAAHHPRPDPVACGWGFFGRFTTTGGATGGATGTCHVVSGAALTVAPGRM